MYSATALCTKLSKKWFFLHPNSPKLMIYIWYFAMEDPVYSRKGWKGLQFWLGNVNLTRGWIAGWLAKWTDANHWIFFGEKPAHLQTKVEFRKNEILYRFWPHKLHLRCQNSCLDQTFNSLKRTLKLYQIL